MSNSVLGSKCLNCGADLKFNPKTQHWDCEYCGSKFTESEISKNEVELNEDTNEKVELDEYSCPNCGAIVVTDKNTTATECVYCGSSAIMKNRLEGKFKPDKIIPFKKQREDGIKAFQEFVKKRAFAPDEFEDLKNIEKTTGVYIPFWLFDCKAEGEYFAKGRKYQYWSDYNYRYKKTDTYDCTRAGNINFTDIPADGSKKFPDDIMDSIEPYDYKEFKPFNYSYLSGFLAEKYDLTADQVYDRVDLRIKNSTIEKLSADVKLRFSNITNEIEKVNVDNLVIEYALLPVWMLNINYNDKRYTFAMNGQTGKMIGNVPVDKKKFILKTLKLFGILFITLLIIIIIIGGIIQ